MEGQRARMVDNVQALDRTTLREVSAERSRQDLDLYSDRLIRFPIGASQPVLVGFAVAAYSGVEQLSRRATMARAGQEEQVATLDALQNKLDTGLYILRTNIRDPRISQCVWSLTFVQE